MQANSVGKFLKTKREERGLTQEFICNRMGWKSPQFLSNIERGESHLPPRKLHTLAMLLRVNASTLINKHIADYKSDYLQQMRKK